jgi:hypothetical protein
MNPVRSRLVAWTLAVLVCQAGLTTVTPIALCRVGSSSASDAADETCTCPLAEGVECPMHKGTTHHVPPRQESGASRWCRGCGDQAAAIVTAFTSAVAVLEQAPPVARPPVTAVALRALTSGILDVDRPPTSPPPRR